MAERQSAQGKGSILPSMLNKVPEITIYFWVIKVLCTTVGETAANFLRLDVGLGLGATTVVMTSFLLAVLWFQFRARRHVPVSIGWLLF